MAENGTTKKPAKGKAKAQESGVLGALPATRPSRLGRHSRGASAAATTPPAKPKPKTRKAAVKKRAATTAATSKAEVKGSQPAASSITDAPRSRPQPVRAASRNLAKPAAKSSARRAPAPTKPPSGTELVGTVVQAAGELAGIGLTVTGQILKRVVEKLPKP
jgi:hypothetical protein